MMRANDVRSNDALRHGAYLCLKVPAGMRGTAATTVPESIERLNFQNEFQPSGEPTASTVAFLRRVEGTPRDLPDDPLLSADAVVHASAESADLVSTLCAEITRLLAPHVTRVLSGVVRPMLYTGNAMHNFSYAHRVLQQPGPVMPHAFLVPLNKTEAWWQKGWMERHTYLLPRFDDSGRMLSEGHALAAASGVDCLLRRTYKNPTEPAPAGDYDFVTYFECTDEDVPRFHDVCAALRDVARNPEWTFVREGPTWHGRRVATWAELFE